LFFNILAIILSKCNDVELAFPNNLFSACDLLKLSKAPTSLLADLQCLTNASKLVILAVFVLES